MSAKNIHHERLVYQIEQKAKLAQEKRNALREEREIRDREQHRRLAL